MTTTAGARPATRGAGPTGVPPADVVDLDVLVSETGAGFEVRLTCPAVDDRSRGEFVPPVTAEDVRRFADAIVSAGTRDMRPLGHQVEDVGARAETIGSALFDAMFDGSGRRVLTRAQDRAKSAGGVLRVRLLLDGVPAVGRLPWELMLDGQRHLVHTTDEFVVRYADDGGAIVPARRDGPLRVLVVAASPRGMPALALDDEYAALLEALEDVRDGVHVCRLERPTLSALRSALAQEWHVLHFMGHGDERAGGNVVALVKEEDAPRTDDDDDVDLVPAPILARHVAAAPGLRLAVLNGCRTGAVSLRRPQDGVAHALVAQGVAAAVAMQFPITDGAAVEFAGGLYRALARGALVDQAVAEGRGRLLRGLEWVTPVLYARTGPRLFEAPAPGPEPAAAAPAPGERVPGGIVPAGPRFQPREWALREVESWLASGSPLLLLTGDHGMGKSVLAAWLVGQGDVPPELAARVEAVRGRWSAVHMSAAALAGASMEPRAFVRDLAEQLATTVPGWRLPDGVTPTDPSLSHLPVRELFTLLLEQPLRAALRLPDAAPAMLLVDGLDEAGSGPEPTTLSLLASLAGLDVPVRMVLAGPNDAALVRPFRGLPDVRRLDLSAPERRAEVDDDVTAFLSRLLAGVGVPPEVLLRVVEAAAGNFLYARHAADQLQATPDPADLALPGDLDDSYDRHVRRVLQRIYGEEWDERWRSAVEPLLGQLSVARAPVPTAALQTWLGWSLPHVAFLLDQLQQLVVTDSTGSRLVHPSLGAMLRAPTLTSGLPNGLVVDATAAHRRVAEAAARLRDSDLLRPDDVGGAYVLVHAPWHLAQLTARSGDHEQLVKDLTDRVVTPAWAQALERSAVDAVVVGLPYRDLLPVLLERGQTERVETLVRSLASTAVPVLRGAVFEALVAYVAHDGAAAESFLVQLATGGEPELVAIALHATCLLSPARQASAFRQIVTRPRPGADVGWGGLVRRVLRGEESTDSLGHAAAFALYANGTADPQRLIREVLDELLTRVSRRTGALPETFNIVEFFSRVTVTNYVNGCSDPAVTRLTSDLWHALLVERLELTTDPGLTERVLVERAMVRELSKRIRSLFAETQDWRGGRRGDGPGRDAARRVIPALDPAVALEPHEADLRVLLASDVTLFRILVAITVAVHGVESPIATVELVRRLLDGADARARRWLLLAHAVVLPRTPDEWVPLLEDLTRAVVSGPHDDDREVGPLRGLHLTFVPLGLAYARAGLPMTVHAQVLRATGGAAGVEGTAAAVEGGPAAAGDVDGHRRCCLHGLGVVGMSHPDAVLAALGTFADDGTLPLRDAAPALAVMSAVHPLRTRAWLLARGERGVLDEVSGRLDVDRSRLHLEFLGMYTNGVHQSLHYPLMRRRLCMTVFSFFLESRSAEEWSRKYTQEGLAMLREAEYELIRWTRT